MTETCPVCDGRGTILQKMRGGRFLFKTDESVRTVATCPECRHDD